MEDNSVNKSTGWKEISQEKKEAARIILRQWKEYRRRLALITQTSEHIGKINDMDNEIIEVQRKHSDNASLGDNIIPGKVDFRRVPIDSIIVIIAYLSTPADFIVFMRTCKAINKVYRYSSVWTTFLTLTYPQVVDFVRERNADTPLDKINLRTVFKNSIDSRDKIIEYCVQEMNRIKEEGNKLFGQEEYTKAVEVYSQGGEIANTINKSLRGNAFFEKLTPLPKILEVYKLLTILSSNSAQASIEEENWAEAYNAAKRASKYLNILKKTLPSKMYKEELDALHKKVMHRLSLSREEILPLFSFVRYSEIPVEELRVGTMLTASDNISGDIFCDSKVLLYEFDRDQVGRGVNKGCSGVIINKSVVRPSGERLRLGGPCEIRDTLITLHNVRGVATKLNLGHGSEGDNPGSILRW